MRKQSKDKVIVMSLFDKIVSMAGGAEGSGQGGLFGQVLDLINSPSVGGLPGLIDKFRNGGLAEIVTSWVGTGTNLPVSGEQMTNALGSDKIREIAASLGLSDTEAADKLASMLPQVIDKLTPQGEVPDGNTLEQGIVALAKQFLNR
jgi:uncharacterized protein YidB (DUF937 family)